MNRLLLREYNTKPVLTLLSKPNSIVHIEQYLQDIFARYSIAQGLFADVFICTSEAVNNAIYHGNSLDASKKVELSYCFSNETLVLKIKDQGIGFDPLTVPNPTLVENLHQPSGRGLFIIKNLCDRLSFSEKGTIIEIQFNL